MRQITAIVLAAIILLGYSTEIFAQKQSENRIKAISVEKYDTGAGIYVPRDSMNYTWAIGAGLGSADFRKFPERYWGWYNPEPIAKYTEQLDFVKSGQQIQYIWNDTTYQFDESAKITITLNASGFITELVVFLNDAGNWKQYLKGIYTHQNDKLILIEVFETPDGINWENNNKSVYTYYASGDLKTYTTYEGLINQQWKPKEKKSFIYANALRVQETTTKWDELSNDWKTHPDNRQDYHYNNKNLCDTTTYLQWNPSDSALEVFNKGIYKYNSNDFMVEELRLNRNNNAPPSLQPFYKRTYSYNYSYPLERIDYKWDNINNKFNKENRWGFTFSGELLKKIGEQRWNETSSTWEPNPDAYSGRQTTFYYEPLDEEEETNIVNLENGVAFDLYPNPASEKITVKLDNAAIKHIQITNINGQIVFQNKEAIHAGEITLPTSQLAPGIYQLQIQSGKKIGVQSFIVKD